MLDLPTVMHYVGKVQNSCRNGLGKMCAQLEFEPPWATFRKRGLPTKPFGPTTTPRPSGLYGAKVNYKAFLYVLF